MTSTGRHYVLREISSGGMGRVELILRREGEFERLYALKRLLPELVASPSVRAMFLDEARIAGLLRHPNVVSVHDVGEDEHGPFLVMDFVEGVSAQLLLQWSIDNDRQLPVGVALEIAIAAAEGLHAAHELCGPNGDRLDLVHRDVSPQNVLVGFDGTVRLTDFGIAKVLGQSAKTSTGILKGKLGYMSPEQLRFERLDRRSDLFSLGVVLFELLAGRRLYRDADGNVTAGRILREPPPDVGQEREDVGPELVGLLFELLAKEAEHRPTTARDVADRLSSMLSEVQLLQDEATLRQFMTAELAELRQAKQAELADARARLDRGELDPISLSGAAARRSRGWIGGLAAALALAVAVGVAIVVWGTRPDERDAPDVVEPPPVEAPGAEPPPEEATVAPPAPQREPVDEAATVDDEAARERRGARLRARAREAAAAMGEVAVPTEASPSSMDHEVTMGVSLGGLPIAAPEDP